MLESTAGPDAVDSGGHGVSEVLPGRPGCRIEWRPAAWRIPF